MKTKIRRNRQTVRRVLRDRVDCPQPIKVRAYYRGGRETEALATATARIDGADRQVALQAWELPSGRWSTAGNEWFEVLP